MLRKIFGKITGKSEQQIKGEALRKAAIKGDLGRVKKLIGEGAEIDYRDVNKLTPLYFAASHGHNDICRLLLEKGADPDVYGAETTLGSPLIQAAYRGHNDVLETLIEFGADLNRRNSMERTALHEAIWRSRALAIMILCDKGADPNTVDSLGGTPLRDAILFDSPAAALKLIQCGADVRQVGKYGEDMREYAGRKGHQDVVNAIDARFAAEAEAKRHAAEEAERKRLHFEDALEKAPVLQSNITVKKKPISLRPKT